MFALHPGAWAPGGIDAAERSSEGRSPAVPKRLRGPLRPLDLPGMDSPHRRYGGFAWSQDGRVIAMWAHAVTRFWRVSDGRAASLIIVRKGPRFGWLAYDDEGHVDGDEEGLSVLRWRAAGGERLLSRDELAQHRQRGLLQSIFEPSP